MLRLVVSFIKTELTRDARVFAYSLYFYISCNGISVRYLYRRYFFVLNHSLVIELARYNFRNVCGKLSSFSGW